DKVLNSLTPREEKVLRLRFGLSDGCEHTLEEVGQDFAVTRERIRQIEARRSASSGIPRGPRSSAASSSRDPFMIANRGPIAQLAEPPAHNRFGLGSSPSGPTTSRRL